MLKILMSTLFGGMMISAFAGTGLAQEAVSAPAPTEAAAPAAAPASNEEKLSDIRRLMAITGGASMGQQMIAQMLDTYRANNPQVPADFWDELAKEMDANALIDLNVPIYDQHFTHEEIKQIIAFYESSIGKKFIEELPKILQESYAAGEQWGIGVAENIRAKLEAKGYLTDAAAPSAPVVEEPAK